MKTSTSLLRISTLTGALQTLSTVAVVTAVAVLAAPITVNNPSFEILPAGGLPIDSCGGWLFL
jgi:hypothetical protein